MRHRKFLTFLIVLFMLFSPFNFGEFFSSPSDIQAQAPIQIMQDETWSGEKEIHGMVFIAPNATLTVEKGSTLIFDIHAEIVVSGTLDVRGTLGDMVTLRGKNSDQIGYQIIVFGEANIRNAKIQDGGKHASVFLTKQESRYRNVAHALDISYGALTVSGGTLYADNVTFSDNDIAVAIKKSGNSLSHSSNAYVQRSSFESNAAYDVYKLSSARGTADFRYNWWEDEGNIYGEVNTDHQREEKAFRDPVIVIPGILGSSKQDEELVLDPIFHTYDDLVETFDENGYTLGVDLFSFPYEWRDSNVENAQLLAQKIQHIREETNWPKVDIIAHSMGGLLSREYIQSDSYSEDVDQLVTLGTPHSGAPKSYLTWDGGEISYPNSKLELSDIWDFLGKKIFNYEAHKNGYDSIFDYVRGRPIASVEELLPVYDYLKNTETDTLREYSERYPQNNFLESLNSWRKLQKLKRVEITNIIGETGVDSTITEIRVGKPSISLENKETYSIWEHGKPEKYDDILGDHGLVFGLGDGTVPFTSARSITADSTVIVDTSHGKLPSTLAPTVYEYITGEQAEHVADGINIDDMVVFFVYSPIDIQVVAPDGKRAGKNFETGELYDEIPGAYYTGYGTDSEFMTIPNPIDGEYEIFTQGTGEGEYRIEATHLSESAELESTKSTIEFSGTAEIGSTSSHTATIEDAVLLALEVEKEEDMPISDSFEEDTVKGVTDEPEEQSAGSTDSPSSTESSEDDESDAGDDSDSDDDTKKKTKSKNSKKIESTPSPSKVAIDTSAHVESENAGSEEEKAGKNDIQTENPNQDVAGVTSQKTQQDSRSTLPWRILAVLAIGMGSILAIVGMIVRKQRMVRPKV